MRVKVFEAATAGTIEEKINTFLDDNIAITVLDINLVAGFGNVFALVKYESNK